MCLVVLTFLKKNYRPSHPKAWHVLSVTTAKCFSERSTKAAFLFQRNFFDAVKFQCRHDVCPKVSTFTFHRNSQCCEVAVCAKAVQMSQIAQVARQTNCIQMQCRCNVKWVHRALVQCAVYNDQWTECKSSAEWVTSTGSGRLWLPAYKHHHYWNQHHHHHLRQHHQDHGHHLPEHYLVIIALALQPCLDSWTPPDSFQTAASQSRQVLEQSWNFLHFQTIIAKREQICFSLSMCQIVKA